MRKLFEDFYHGNLAPDEQKMAPDSELRRLVGKAADCVAQLIKRLDKAEQKVAKLLKGSDSGALEEPMEGMEV